MTATYRIRSRSTASTGPRRATVSSHSSISSAHVPVIVGVPQDQLYYWTRLWQENEQIAAEELERGKSRQFDTAKDAIRWLFSDED